MVSIFFLILLSGSFATQDQPLTNQTPARLNLDVNASAPEDRNVYTVIGKILNNDTVPFNGVRVSAILYDNDGQSLVERSVHIL